MKATEVRIGNWVYINNRHLMKVSSISIDSGIMCIAHVPENNCYPIPLNRDIILQCGFGEVGMYENVYHKDNIRIHFDKNCKDDETGTVLFIVYNETNQYSERKFRPCINFKTYILLCSERNWNAQFRVERSLLIYPLE